MKTNPVYDIVCIGNYTKDTIISPSGTKYVDGGGMNYAAHAAARLGLKVAVVTRLAKFTVSPHRSYVKRLTPITPAMAGPVAMPMWKEML